MVLSAVVGNFDIVAFGSCLVRLGTVVPAEWSVASAPERSLETFAVAAVVATAGSTVAAVAASETETVRGRKLTHRMIVTEVVAEIAVVVVVVVVVGVVAAAAAFASAGMGSVTAPRPNPDRKDSTRVVE